MNYGRLLMLAAFAFPAGGAPAAAAEPKTVITGDQMQIKNGGQTVIFSGHSKVLRGKSVLRADRLVQDKKKDRIEAVGNVDFETFSAEGERVLGRSGYALYRPGDETGELSGDRPEVIYHVKESTAPVRLLADVIHFDQKKEELRANGNVEILSSSACAYSPQALFRQDKKEVLLTGAGVQPEVVYRSPEQNGRYRADTITLFIDRKEILFEGNVRGNMRVRERQTER